MAVAQSLTSRLISRKSQAMWDDFRLWAVWGGHLIVPGMKYLPNVCWSSAAKSERWEPFCL